MILYGWIHNIRKMKDITFFDLANQKIFCQCVLKGPSISKNGFVILSGEWKKINNLKEFHVSKILYESTSSEKINLTKDEFGESAQLKDRHMYLRQRHMQKNMKLRSDMFYFIRTIMHDVEFLEINTPILSIPTPEGARDFVVPSRYYDGKYYALY